MTRLVGEADIGDVQRRLNAAQQHASDAEGGQPMLAEILADASVLLEELYVANEEIRAQNDQLDQARVVVEEERLHYQQLFDLAPDGYIVTDEDAVISQANRTALAMVGVGKEWLVGKPLLVFIARESHDAFMECLAHLRAGIDAEDLELLIAPRNGIPFSADVKVLVAHETPAGEPTWRWLIRDITVRKAQEALRVTQESRIATLEAQAEITALEAIATERDRIGRDLHDSVSQVLGYMRFRLQSVYDLLEQGNLGQARLGMEELIKETRTANEDLRQAISGLRISSILREGLVVTLDEYLRRFQEQVGVTTELAIDADAQSRFSPTTEIQVQSVIHEAFTNIRKHSQARRATVHFNNVNGRTAIVITDDGVGFDVAALQGNHFGLGIMHERARLINAELRIDSRPGNGTRLTLTLPRSQAAKSSHLADAGNPSPPVP